jgi:hypothetical protein
MSISDVPSSNVAAYINNFSDFTDDGSANFINPKIAACTDPKKGWGIIASAKIERGETLIVYGGGFIDRAHLEQVPVAVRRYFYQVSDEIWYGHGLDNEGLGLGERLNHSCVPNSVFVSSSRVVSSREIDAGEELTLDYALLQTEDFEGSSFECGCGYLSCRGSITINDWRAIKPNSSDYHSAQPFIRARIAPQGGAVARIFSSFMFPQFWRNPVIGRRLQSVLFSGAVEFDRAGLAVATQHIRRNEIVALMGGKLVPFSARARMPLDRARLFSRFSSDLLTGPRYNGDVELGRVVMSSVRPNLRRELDHFFVADRDLLMGEQLTYNW